METKPKHSVVRHTMGNKSKEACRIRDGNKKKCSYSDMYEVGGVSSIQGD